MTTIIDSIKTLEVEFTQLYTKNMGVWTQLNDDKVQQEISQKIYTTHGKVRKLQETMGTLPPIEVVIVMNENQKMY
jgi:hypothetical protein